MLGEQSVEEDTRKTYTEEVNLFLQAVWIKIKVRFSWKKGKKY